MISYKNYKDFLQLKSSDIFGIAYNTLKLYGAVFERMDLDNLMEEPIVNLSDLEKENILNGFFSTVDSRFKNKYNELVSNNKIVLVDIIDGNKNILGRLYDFKLPSEDKEQTIKIVPQNNDFLFLSVLIHEIVHAVEWDELKKHIKDDEKYCDYVNNSLYIEVLPVYFEAKFCDYLDSIGIDKDIIIHLKRQIIYNGGELLCEVFDIESKHNLKNNRITLKNGDYTYNDFDIHNSIMRSYATMLQMYFNNIEDEDEKIRVIDKYNEIKYNAHSVDIFDELGCCNKVLYKSIKRQVLKCK